MTDLTTTTSPGQMTSTQPSSAPIRLLVSTLSKTLVATGALWLLLQIIGYFIPGNPWSTYRWVGLVFFLVTGLVCGLGWDLIVTHTHYMKAQVALQEAERLNATLNALSTENSSRLAADSLLTMLREAHSRNAWREVILVGRPLSRPLWLTGHYQLRIEIGKLVESAAALSEQPEIQAAALIDDIGWTNVALRHYDEAVKCIQRGLGVAKDANAHGLVCRALRHLAGIAVKQKDIEKAEDFSSQAEKALTLVTNTAERNELTAGLAYQRATQLQLKGLFPEALSLFLEAQQQFTLLSDRDRSIKIFGSIGQVHLAMENLDEAKDSFRHGLVSARVSSRPDCELVSLVGLARVAQMEGSFSEAKKNLREASAIALNLRDSTYAAELAQKASS